MNQSNVPSGMPSTMMGDMRFVGMFNIIYGALVCLSIIGAIIGVPLIICGMRLREAADAFSAYQSSNDIDALHRGFERQSRFFSFRRCLSSWVLWCSRFTC